MSFELAQDQLEHALRRISKKDRDVAAALERFGFPEERRNGAPSFDHLLKVLAGQQLSVRAAAAIHARLIDLLGDPPTPENLLRQNDNALRSIGLSRQKISYARGLSEAIDAGRFDPDTLETRTDTEVIEALTALKGFGVWSAQMVLIFSLGRRDIWPIDDLGIQSGLQRLKQLVDRPDRKQAAALGETWRPDRSAMALLMWHLHGQPRD